MRYVIAVAEEGSFHGAAGRLHIAQPPLSRQIRDLERQLGVQLFRRRPTVLTDAGRIFTESARRILTEVDEMVEHTIQAGLGTQGRVRIGYILTAGYDTLPVLMSTMRHEHPGIRVEAREGWTPDLERDLHEGLIDILLSRNVTAHPNIETVVLRRELLVAVTTRAHALAHRRSISLRELRGNTFCYFPRSFAPANHEVVSAALRSTGENFPVSEHLAPGLRHPPLTDEHSFTLLPASMIGHLPAGTVGIPLTDDLPTLDLSMAWPRASAAGPIGTVIAAANKVAAAKGWTSGPVSVNESSRP